MKVHAISRIRLVCADLSTTARFYQAALGFERIGEGEIDAGRVVTLRLGNQSIDLTEVRPHGHPYPDGVSGANLLFQHFAIVVADMPSVYRQLLTQGGWTAISSDGPQRLPPASGGVTAFKFRDPEGHPLELLAFPDGSAPPQWRSRSACLFLGIDHSALSVADTARSVAFYKGLGFAVQHRSQNAGPEQDRLDGMTAVEVEVTALVAPVSPTPHIELLCYRDPHPVSIPLAPNDIAATRLVLAAYEAAEFARPCARQRLPVVPGSRMDKELPSHVIVRDPDGHLLLLAPH